MRTRKDKYGKVLLYVLMNWRIIKKMYKPFLMIKTKLLYLIDGCFLSNKIT